MNKAPHPYLQPYWRSFPAQESALDYAKQQIEGLLINAIDSKGSALFAAAGGETPKPLYAALSHSVLPWDKVSILPTDERWVPYSHPYSNARMLEKILLQNNASRAQIIPLYAGAPAPAEAVPFISDRLNELKLPIDVTLIGMGTDGHAASLFPGAPELSHALDLRNPLPVSAITPDPMPAAAPVARMSLSLSTLAASDKLYLLIFGEDKLETLHRAFDDNFPFDPPVRKVIEAAGDKLEILWAP